MSSKTIEIQKCIDVARRRSFNFDRMVKLCDAQIELFISKIEASNNKPTTHFRMPYTPSEVRVRVFLPVIPISPNETQLLLSYLNNKYINGDKGALVGGHYFSIRKCFFSERIKLSTHRDWIRSIDDYDFE